MIKLRSHQLTAVALFLTIAVSYWVIVNWFPVAYIWATYEDLYGEWGQTYFFATACVMSLLVVKSKSSFRWFFAVLALALFYTVMEEISWGQRIFDIKSPDFFKDNNLQRETNLHNMLVGPFSTDLKAFMELLVASALMLYGAAYPLLLKLRFKPATWVYGLGVAAPPLYLLPFFLTASVLELGWYNFNEAEIAELLIGFALSIMAIHYWVAQHYEMDVAAHSTWAPHVTHRLSVFILGVFICVASLSAITTKSIYSNPDKRQKIDARLLNGYEKFAKRYSSYRRWDIASDLYLQVHIAEPQRTSILRRLAMTYKESGDKKQFKYYTLKALDIALKKYAKNKNKISTNLSLSRTYKQLGQPGKSGEHGLSAHKIALQRAEDKPDSAHWAYWLGKTYRNLENYQAASIQFEKAFNLKPSSKKYRKAYYKTRQSIGQ